ncbi:hypothetical protein OC844_007432 [Tilletia horrida]|nr:hypothetical protein OC844_007432 [Tilletia horrida]
MASVQPQDTRLGRNKDNETAPTHPSSAAASAEGTASAAPSTDRPSAAAAAEGTAPAAPSTDRPSAAAAAEGTASGAPPTDRQSAAAAAEGSASGASPTHPPPATAAAEGNAAPELANRPLGTGRVASRSSTGPPTTQEHRTGVLLALPEPLATGWVDPTPRVEFLRKTGEALQGEAVAAQNRPCYEAPGVEFKDFCRQCADRQTQTEEQRSKAVVEGREFECWWQGVRAMRASHGQKRKRPGGDDGASHSMERVVVDAYLHERVDADGDAYSLALELTPIIQTELNHAANRRMQPLLRSGGVAALQRCTQCSVYVCGSWQCVACGAELCLSCFRLVCETPAVTLASYATADHLISCKQAKDELYYAHKAEDFVPVARLTVAELSMHRAFARTVTQAYRQSALDGQDEMAADIAEWRRVDRPWGKRMRQREDAGVNITKNKVTVLRAGSECDIDERSQAVLLSLLALGEPLVIQQDLVAPLDDDELSRLFDPRTPIPVRAMMDNDPSMTMQEGEWPWEKVAAALCGVGSEDIRYLDTRDFPADGQLRDISPGAADAFLRASSFPDDPTSGNTGIKSECTRVFERLSDMSAWIAPIVTARNGKDLCYAALGAEDDEDGEYEGPGCRKVEY